MTDDPVAVETPTDPPRPGFFARLSPLGRVIAALIGFVSFVTGIIAVVPILTRDATNFSSLRISASVFASELEYAIAGDASLEEFPVGAPGTCTPAQQAWLDANAQPITTRYLVDLRNVAAEGPMLALKSFRGEGEVSNDDPMIKVVCNPTGSGGTQVQAARLVVSDPAAVAYFDKSAFGQTVEGIPDSPVVWNLAPGETGQLVVSLYPTAAFTGSLAVTAVSGTEERSVQIPQDGAPIAVPGLLYGGATFLQVDGGLQCIRLEGAERVGCSIEDLVR